MRVFVYKNSRRKCWSLRACGGEQDGRVIGYANFLVLKDCEFAVERAGWKKYMETDTKNVHAGVRGTIVMCSSDTWESNIPFNESEWRRGNDQEEVVYVKSLGCFLQRKKVITSPATRAETVWMKNINGSTIVTADGIIEGEISK